MNKTTRFFRIEDVDHCDVYGDKYSSLAEAEEVLRKLAKMPWNKEPNLVECVSCAPRGRVWTIVEYEDQDDDWELVAYRESSLLLTESTIELTLESES